MCWCVNKNSQDIPLNMGVTIGTYKEYRKKKGLPEPSVDDLKKLPKEEWTDIMKGLYWK